MTENKKTECSLEDTLEKKRSCVRILVTYGAALFLFLGGAIFIIYLIKENCLDKAITLFNTILPVAAAIISYWFAARRPEKKKEDQLKNGDSHQQNG